MLGWFFENPLVPREHFFNLEKQSWNALNKVLAAVHDSSNSKTHYKGNYYGSSCPGLGLNNLPPAPPPLMVLGKKRPGTPSLDECKIVASDLVYR